ALARSRTALVGLLAASGPVAAHDDPVGPLIVRTLLTFGGLLAPFCLAAAVVGAGAVVAQVGWSVNPGLLLPDPGRINPSNGLKRIFSANGAMNLVKAVAKIAVVATVAYRVLLRTGAEAIGASGMMPAELLGFTGAGLRRLFLTMAVALAVLGGLDYLWQRRRHEQSLKMSRHEVKEEHKETEGNPQVKTRFRRAHREIARRRMLTEVKRADVVLTNPVHVAVALRYRASETAAPHVLAVPLALVAVVVIMVIPLPAFLIDLLLAVSISLALVILMVSMYTQQPLEFSTFPSVLLVVTLFRLALNVASTRLILLHGHEGAAAAGHVIRAFGNFVVGGSYVVGLVVFLILVVINFAVITKGAGRIAEVAARFTLDAMPGKQL